MNSVQAPEGESQPSTDVDLFVSTEKIMVLNTDLQVGHRMTMESIYSEYLQHIDYCRYHTREIDVKPDKTNRLTTSHACYSVSVTVSVPEKLITWCSTQTCR